MHFWWCGFVCAHALIDVDQGAGDEDKKNSCSRGRDLLFNKFRNLLGDKLHYGFFMCAIIGVCFFCTIIFCLETIKYLLHRVPWWIGVSCRK